PRRPRPTAVTCLGLAALAALWLAGCAGAVGTPRSGAGDEGPLSDQTLRLNSAAPPLTFTRPRVVTDNDTAFETKLEAVRGARHSIDLAYYIYATDYSSAMLTSALIDAARRGVRVQLLADYFTNYRSLDHLAMMEREGNGGAGSLEVRLYG